MEIIWPLLPQNMGELEENLFSFCLGLLMQTPALQIPPLANLSVPSLYPSRSSAGLWHGALGTSDAVRGHGRHFHLQQSQTVRGFGLSFIIDLIHI